MQTLVWVMCHHGQGPWLCLLCNCPSLCKNSLLHHLLVHHTQSLGLGDLHCVEDVTAEEWEGFSPPPPPQSYFCSAASVWNSKFSKLQNLFNSSIFCMVLCVLYLYSYAPGCVSNIDWLIDARPFLSSFSVFSERPTSVNATLESHAAFCCISIPGDFDVTWKVNGTFLNNLANTTGINTTVDGTRNCLSIRASEEYNNTIIECVVLDSQDGKHQSTSAKLTVQGWFQLHTCSILKIINFTCHYILYCYSRSAVYIDNLPQSSYLVHTTQEPSLLWIGLMLFYKRDFFT